MFSGSSDTSTYRHWTSSEVYIGEKRYCASLRARIVTQKAHVYLLHAGTVDKTILIVSLRIQRLTVHLITPWLYFFWERRFIYIRYTSLFPILGREAINNGLESLL